VSCPNHSSHFTCKRGGDPRGSNPRPSLEPQSVEPCCGKLQTAAESAYLSRLLCSVLPTVSERSALGGVPVVSRDYLAPFFSRVRPDALPRIVSLPDRRVWRTVHPRRETGLPGVKRGLLLLPRRWAVERSFAWISRFRRLARDYERLQTTLMGLHFVAFACLMVPFLLPLFTGACSPEVRIAPVHQGGRYWPKVPGSVSPAFAPSATISARPG
jgi:hypothetical protein